MTVPNKQKPWETAREARVRRVRSIVFVLVCAAVSACSGPHAAPTIAFAEFPDTLARRICEVQSQCHPPPWFEMEGCVWRQRTSWDMDVLRAAFEAVLWASRFTMGRPRRRAFPRFLARTLQRIGWRFSAKTAPIQPPFLPPTADAS